MENIRITYTENVRGSMFRVDAITITVTKPNGDSFIICEEVDYTGEINPKNDIMQLTKVLNIVTTKLNTLAKYADLDSLFRSYKEKRGSV